MTGTWWVGGAKRLRKISDKKRELPTTAHTYIHITYKYIYGRAWMGTPFSHNNSKNNNNMKCMGK